MRWSLPTPEPRTPGWKPPRFTLQALMLCVTVFCIGLGLLALINQSHKYLGRLRDQKGCENNLKQIGIALYTYHDVWNCFPPATRTDSSGKPLHSWRFLMYPMLESNNNFDHYDMTEPWNGPINKKFNALYPLCFRCPEDHTSAPGTTNYVAITGPGTGWPAPNQSSRISDFKDGLANSIMVVEIRNSDIHWMEPRDLDIRTLKLAINSDGKNSISSRHIGGAFVLYGDGAVEYLSNQETEARLQKMVLIADETVDEAPRKAQK